MNDLFDTPVYQRHSRTSYEAAEAIKPSRETLQRKVLAYLKTRGGEGATDIEIQRDLNMRGSTERPRRRELEDQGLVIDSGLTRKTPTGRSAVVWRVA